MSLLLLLKGGDEPQPTPHVAVQREFPSDKLAVKLVLPGRQKFRWGEDEPQVEDVLTGLRKSGEMPGGHNEASMSLARDPRVDYPDLPPGGLYADLYVEDASGEEVWAGRLDKAPESDGDRMLIEPAAVGWQRALEDDKGVIGPGFVNSDLNAWGEAGAQRRSNVEGAGLTPVRSLTVESDEGGNSKMSMFVNGEFDDTEAEAVFDGNGIPLARLIVDHLERVGLANDALLTAKPRAWATDTAGAEELGAEYKGASSIDFSPAAAARYMVLNWKWSGSGPAGSVNGNYGFRYRGVKVLSDHGLALQDSESGSGFTAKQMLLYAIPLYTALSASDESLEDDGYVIPHAWFSDPGPMAAVVQELTKYGLYDWFVFGGRLFQLRAPGTYGRRWQAYAGPSELKEAGLDGERLWESILVSYQDVDGSTRTVGPPGSGAHVEEEGLRITDPDHPAVKAEITRKDVLVLSGISTPARATEAGERWLREANELSRSGSCNLKHYILDDCAVFRPASQVQPGDHVRFPDSGSDRSYRKIVAVDYDHDTRTAACTLDAPPEGYKALLERMQADIRSLAL